LAVCNGAVTGTHALEYGKLLFLVAVIGGLAVGIAVALDPLPAIALLSACLFLLFLNVNLGAWLALTMAAAWLAPPLRSIPFVSDLLPSYPVVFIVFLLVLCRFVATPEKVSFRTRILVPFLLYAGAQGATTVLVLFNDPALLSYKQTFVFIVLGYYYVLCWLVIQHFKYDDSRLFFRALVAVSACVVAIGFVEHLGTFYVSALKPFNLFVRAHYNNPFTWRELGWGGPTPARVGGTFDGSPNGLGAFAAFSGVLFLSLSLDTSKSLRKRAIFLALLVLSTATLIATSSRGGLVNFAVGAIAVLLLSGKVRLHTKVVLAVLVSAAVVFLVIRLSAQLERFTVFRDLFAGKLLADANLAGRFDSWRANFALFAAAPIFGVGSTLKLRVLTDNQYLWVLVRYGVVGFAAMLFLFGHVVRDGLKALKTTRGTEHFILLAMVAAVLGMMAHALVSEIFAVPRMAEIYWIAFGIIEGIAAKHGSEATYGPTEE